MKTLQIAAVILTYSLLAPFAAFADDGTIHTKAELSAQLAPVFPALTSLLQVVGNSYVQDQVALQSIRVNLVGVSESLQQAQAALATGTDPETAQSIASDASISVTAMANQAASIKDREATETNVLTGVIGSLQSILGTYLTLPS